MSRVSRWTLPSTRNRDGGDAGAGVGGSTSTATVPDPATLGAARPRFSDLTLSLGRLSEAQQRGGPAAEHSPQRLGHRRRQRAKPLGPVVPGRFGWDLPGGGVTAIVDAPPEFRGPSVQVAGMYPFSAGGTLPMIGATLGPHQFGRGIVCADPVSWFGAQLITNPSAFVLGRPGVGKSSLVARIVLQVVPKGIIPLLLSDIKGEYVNLIRDGLQGQVIAPGRGTEFINPLDRGPLIHRIADLPAKARAQAEADMDARRNNVMVGLCELALGRPLEAHERNVLSRAPRLWEEQHPSCVPVVADVLALIQSRPERLATIVQDRGNTDRYDQRVERLVDALLALSGDGEFGEVFAHPTTNPLQMHRPAVFDLSAVDAMDSRLQAGLQLVCWSYGSAAVTAAKYLGDAALAPKRTYLMVMDELWKPLKAAEFMVYRIDEITRMNRTLNLAQILITHTMDDLKLPTPAARETAFGFVSRSEMVFLGGLAPGEMGNLSQVFAMSRSEETEVASWSEPGRVNPETGHSDPPPGRGKFLLKVGQSAGIPFKVLLTPAEIAIHDTNLNWRDTFASLARRGRRTET